MSQVFTWYFALWKFGFNQKHVSS